MFMDKLMKMKPQRDLDVSSRLMNMDKKANMKTPLTDIMDITGHFL